MKAITTVGERLQLIKDWELSGMTHSVHTVNARMSMRAFYCASISGLPCLDEALTF